MSHDHAHKFDPANVARLDDPMRLASMPHRPLVEALSPGAADRVLDIGCGTGYWLRALLDSSPVGTRFWGADAEPAMLRHLEERLRDHPRRADVQAIRSDEHSLPLPDASIDIAVMGAVYHELADRRAYLAEIRRVLAPGGRLAIVDWDVLPDGVERVGGPPSDHRVAAAVAEAELRDAGFTRPVRVDGFVQSYALVARRDA